MSVNLGRSCPIVLFISATQKQWKRVSCRRILLLISRPPEVTYVFIPSASDTQCAGISSLRENG